MAKEKGKIDVKLDKVSIGALDRQNLYQLFIENSIPSIKVEDIEKDSATKTKEGEIRHKADKLMFLSFLMDYDFENQIKYRKNARYDYLTGLLLYVSSNPQFKYGYGYFKESIRNFDKMLQGWCKLINAIITDINCLDKILFAKKIIIQIDDILQITIEEDKITAIDANLEKSNYFSCKWSNEYDFNIVIPDGENTKVIASGKGNGFGLKSGLRRTIMSLANLYESLILRNKVLTTITHNDYES